MKKGVIILFFVFLLSFSFVLADEVACDESNIYEFDEAHTYDGHEISLIEVSSSAAVVQVDDVMEIISLGNSREINGLLIRLDEVYYRTEYEESSAVLTILCFEEVSCGSDFVLDLDDDDTVSYESSYITVHALSATSAVIQVGDDTEIVAEGASEGVGGLLLTVVDINSVRNEATLSIACLEDVTCGEEFTLFVDDAVTYDRGFGPDSSIILWDVSSTSAIVEVDGTTEIIGVAGSGATSGQAFINGILVHVLATDSEDERLDSSATLEVSCSAGVLSCTESKELYVGEIARFGDDVVYLSDVSSTSVVVVVNDGSDIVGVGDTAEDLDVAVYVESTDAHTERDESSAELSVNCDCSSFGGSSPFGAPESKGAWRGILSFLGLS